MIPTRCSAYSRVQRRRRSSAPTAARQRSAILIFILMEKKPEDMRDTLELLLGDASAAFEKLPLIQDEGILRNILYSGVWQGYNEYLHRKDKKMKKESEVEGHGE